MGQLEQNLFSLFTRKKHEPFMAKSRGRTAYIRLSLSPEKFEERLPMDAGGLVTTPLLNDVGAMADEIGVELQDDYFNLTETTTQIRLDVLTNDPRAVVDGQWRIIGVSETDLGATVSVSDDGQRIIYTPDNEPGSDSFFYFAEDSAGNLGKASVKLTVTPSDTPRHFRWHADDAFTVDENSPEQNLDVIQNDGYYAVAVEMFHGEIVEVRSLSNSEGTIRIADDGKSLFYQPATGMTGLESYEYVVKAGQRDIATFRAQVTILKPYYAIHDQVTLDYPAGIYALDVLANDRQRAETPEMPRIVDVSPAIGGNLTISEDGQRVLLEPADGFLGKFSFTYTVRYGPHESQISSQWVTVNLSNTFLAVDNWFRIEPNSNNNQLNVLENDRVFESQHSLSIIDINGGSQGGAMSIENGQSLRYTPRPGFSGEETFNYVVVDSNGYRQSATVTLHVEERDSNLPGDPNEILPGELRQFFIDKAVEHYGPRFGTAVTIPTYNFRPLEGTEYHYPEAIPTGIVYRPAFEFPQDQDRFRVPPGGIATDLFARNGNVAYSYSGGKLTIVDVSNAENPVELSQLKLGDNYSEIHLIGNRLTLIGRGGYSGWWCDGFSIYALESPSVVTTLDVSNLLAPQVLERTEYDARITETHVAGEIIHFTLNGVNLPELLSHPLAADTQGQEPQVLINETLNQYLARLEAVSVEDLYPEFRRYDANRTLVASGSVANLAFGGPRIRGEDNSLEFKAWVNTSGIGPVPPIDDPAYTSTPIHPSAVRHLAHITTSLYENIPEASMLQASYGFLMSGWDLTAQGAAPEAQLSEVVSQKSNLLHQTSLIEISSADLELLAQHASLTSNSPSIDDRSQTSGEVAIDRVLRNWELEAELMDTSSSRLPGLQFDSGSRTG